MEKLETFVKPHIRDDWSEEIGFALWWDFPIIEPPYCGSPLCDDFPEYKTHFTLLPPVENIEQIR